MKTITERLAIYTATIPVIPRRKAMLSITVELETTSDWDWVDAKTLVGSTP